MDEESEVIIRTISESDESDGCKESVRISDNDLSFENAIDAHNDIGRISLEFADADATMDTLFSEYPSSYYTFSAKERLLLIFTENFRRHFISTYPDRKRLVLAVSNECGIQKFVSTTVRSTSFLFNELIDCWQGPAQFVADFITYEPLADPLQLVSKTKEKEKNTHFFFFFYSGRFY